MGGVWSHFFFLLFLIQLQLTAEFGGVKNASPLPRRPGGGGGGGGVPATSTEAGTRRNTLLDDADDLQRQLDNEAKERYQYPKPKTVWMLHKPEKTPSYPEMYAHRDYGRIITKKRKQMIGYSHFNPRAAKARSIANDAPEWSYSSSWIKDYPLCGGHAQSPVSIPSGGGGMVAVRSTRLLKFKNYDVIPQAMTLRNDGKKLVLTGRWPQDKRPSLWGGAALSRRYIFHSVELHWFSEHRVGPEQYPCELQATHYAAEYPDYETALLADDPESLLNVAYLYLFEKVAHPPGISTLISAAVKLSETTNPFSNNDKNIDATSSTKAPEISISANEPPTQAAKTEKAPSEMSVSENELPMQAPKTEKSLPSEISVSENELPMQAPKTEKTPSDISISENEQSTKAPIAEKGPSEISISENGPPMTAYDKESIDIETLKPYNPSEKADINTCSTKETTVKATTHDQFSDPCPWCGKSNDAETPSIIVNSNETCDTNHNTGTIFTAHTQSIIYIFGINDYDTNDDNTNAITTSKTPKDRMKSYANMRSIRDNDAALVEDTYNFNDIKNENEADGPSVMPLTNLFPVFKKDYATYSGSLTAPPCKENVRWIVYSRPLGIPRDILMAAQSLRSVDGRMKANYRPQQPLNDRQIYYFH